MGFDITVNRLNDKVNAYLNTHNLSREDCVFWITGHSRGGALANILAAKRINIGDEVFAYTFASPATTTYETATTANKYQCIFNLINEDDLVPQLPMEDWGFVRYGKDKTASIETDGYADDWDEMTGLEYTSNQAAMNNVVSAFNGIADNRNQCYTYREGLTAYYVDMMYSSYDGALMAAMAVVSSYPANTAGTYYWVSTGSAVLYGYAVYQQPAFLMQLIAAYMGNEIDQTSFVLTRVAPYMGTAKERMINLGGLNLSLANNIQHPHYCESYYLLSLKTEE